MDLCDEKPELKKFHMQDYSGGDFKFDRLDEGSGRYTVEISGLGRKKSVEANLGDSVNLGEIRL